VDVVVHSDVVDERELVSRTAEPVDHADDAVNPRGCLLDASARPMSPSQPIQAL
jgi:hypothetical protein